MPHQFYFSAFLLAASLSAPLATQAQTAAEPAAPAPTKTAPAPGFQSATLFKLGTGLTRGLTIGGFMGTALPLVASVEHNYAPAWSVYGNVSSGWRIGARTAAPERGTRSAYVTEVGADLGVRHYYNQEKRQAAGRAAGPFVGNYVALQGSTSFTPYYAPKLYHEVSALSVLWGTQHRLGSHGLLDAYVGGGLETRRLNMSYRGVQIRPHLEVGIKLSLVR
ncbi:hypothetical protein KBK19_09680 [Microvirga sp. STR05]|uniref:DUF3575 domain-containing protein n=1 Tax=Hymenobacter duratus TaxID=2771356 RepID=A0ABR8JEM2_9BACT|nr:hypothetical protein [Hymenobacter duratus]MBD2715305.1 hypothetical protein [Hymenobacter duratus]MBR7950212.1 hypothetical protein [Microvirga sp. STR05]